MPFLFTCPTCHCKTRVEDRYSGQSGECVSCGGAIQIPLFAPTDGLDSEQPGKPLPWMVAAGVMLVLLGCLVFWIFQYGGDTMKKLTNNKVRNASMKNLEKIAAALNAYAVTYGTYPPPAVLDSTGTPLLSWRVLILPFLGEDTLYSQFNLDEAWNSPQNQSLSYSMPEVFRHPDQAEGGGFYDQQPDYYLVVGKGTLFPPAPAPPLGPKDVLDAPTQTLLVVEGAPGISGHQWIEPIDLDFAKMTGQVNGPAKDDPGGELLTDGAAMVTVDGRAHFLPNETTPVVFNALVTPNGGEPLPDDTLD